MFENITEVIGFDLGHGETALAHIYVDDLDKTSEPELLEIFGGEKNITTAIGYYPDHLTQKIWIGESALTNQNIKESYITFKKKPSGDLKYLKIMGDYIKTIYENQVEQGRIKENESFFIVGCPSEWTQDRAIVKAYEKLFSDAGIQRVKVVAESRAAYIHAVEKGMLNIAQLKGCVVVIDLGSSTTDITLLNQNKNSIPIDVGRNLGAALIDKAIFQWVLKNHRHKVELEDIFSSYPYFQNKCELVCRKVKEAYFSAPENYQESGQYAGGVFAKMQGIYFEPEVDGNVMNEILDTPIVDLGSGLQTWASAFLYELLRLKQELGVRQQFESSNDFSPGVIILTGGASRMNFVKEICKQVFPQASVESDNTPEFSIARGLARWGRVEINTSQFSRDVEKFCSNEIRPRVASQIDSLYDAISAVLADKTISIIKRNFDLWKSRNHLTINKMKDAIDSEIKYSLQEKNLSKLFGEEIKLVLNKLSKDLRMEIKGLESKYSIPIGQLGESLDLRNITMGNITIGNQSNVDATDGLISQFSSIVAWISGVLAGVAAYAVAPFVLGMMIALTSIVSTTLFSMLLTFFLTPVGWPVLASFGIFVTVATLAGKKTKESVKSAIEENLPSWDIPLWVRNTVKSDSVYSKVNNERKTITNQLNSKLKSEEKIRQELIDKITSIFESNLKAQAEDIKALIS